MAETVSYLRLAAGFVYSS